jgi:DNA polymerase-3 subunit epsilon
MVVSQQTKEEREKQNALLKEYGFNWKREGSLWRLIDAHNQIVSLETALVSIRSGHIEKPKPVYSTANRAAAIQWAHSLTTRTQRERPVVFLDTETTGLGMSDVAIQIGIIDLRGNVLMNFLVHPDSTEISQGAFETHGMSSDKLSDAPMFTSIWVELRAILQESDLLIYNASYDVRILAQTAHKYGLTLPPLRTHCVMQQHAMFVGEVISQPLKTEAYKTHKLIKACEDMGIEYVDAHDALADAKSTRDVLIAMAKLYEE